MANLLDYVLWRGDVPFSLAPFNDADSLVLSEFAYAPLEDVLPDGERVPLRELAERVRGDGARWDSCPPQLQRLIEALAASERFRDIRAFSFARHYDADVQSQFAAVSLALPFGETYVAFRGTNNTLMGWKEDFNMSFTYPVPSQDDGRAYLNRVAAETDGPIRTGGHSKGGNVAVYAAATCEPAARERVTIAYNHDGPGFLPSFLESEAFRAVRDRVRVIVPQSSVVGMLLEHETACTVVRSDARSLLSHDPFTWRTRPDGLETASDLDEGSKVFDASVRLWVSQFEPEQRRAFIDGVYELLRATNAATVQELMAGGPKNAVAIFSAWRAIDPQTRKLLFQVFGSLFRSVMRSLPQNTQGRHLV